MRDLEGLPRVTGWLRGGGSTAVVLQEHSWQLALDVAEGHKTGFYLDQRDAGRRFSRPPGMASGSRCSTAFATPAASPRRRSLACGPPAWAGQGACHVHRLVRPRAGKRPGQRGAQRFRCHATTWLDADVNASLRAFDREGRRLDAIVLDPPKLAPTAAHAERAARAYKDNRLGFKLLNPGGMLFTYSCSGGIGVELFQKIVASTALEAGVDAVITHRSGWRARTTRWACLSPRANTSVLVVVARPRA